MLCGKRSKRGTSNSWRPFHSHVAFGPKPTFSANAGMSAFGVVAHNLGRASISPHCAPSGRAGLAPYFAHTHHARFARRVTLSQLSAIAENQKRPYPPRHPASTRGTLRPIVTKREAGCDGCVGCIRRAQVHACGEIAWSRCPDAGIKLAGERCRPDALDPPTTEAIKPGTPGRSRISR